MTRKPVTNVAASVRARLLTLAKQRGEQFERLLQAYVIERFLHRLGTSELRERFIVKGAMLLAVWGGGVLRPTRDLDLLGFGDSDADHLRDVIRSICGRAADIPDGIVFDLKSVEMTAIRDADDYAGTRVLVWASLGSARIRMQIDVGFGDTVHPAPEWVEFPTMIDLPAPRVRAYPREASIAEKIEAIVALGETNSRLKDFYDLFALARETEFAGYVLVESVRRTFATRGTRIPEGTPPGLGDAFLANQTTLSRWSGFIADRNLIAPTLSEVGTRLRAFVLPLLQSARPDSTERSPGHWRPDSGWVKASRE
jgi:predicted nucleotidyltransferase component of viral defense system